MGTKHIRHLVTELAARLSDRDFLRKAGISRRTCLLYTSRCV